MRISKQPAPAKTKPWQKMPRVGYGPVVTPADRKHFLAEMAVHPHITDLGHRILARLVLHYDGENGIYPRYQTIARDVNCTRKATAIENIARLSWLGAIEVVMGAGIKTESGYTNRFIVHWPEGWGDNVVKLTVPK